MEPTESLFSPIFKIVFIVLFASIPFMLGILVNVIVKHHKFFLITGKIISVLLSLIILVLFGLTFIYSDDISFSRLYYGLACLICGLFVSVLPISTFYLTISKKTKKKKFGIFAISFIFFFSCLSAFEFITIRAFSFVFETERTEISIDKFYKDYPDTDRNSDINLHIFMTNGAESFTANISMYKDSISLKTIEITYIAPNNWQTDSCYRNDLPPDLVQDIIEEIIHYQPEIEYNLYADLCMHPSISIELANNKKTTAIELKFPDLDAFHPNAQRIAKKINDLVKPSKFNSPKGCRN